LAYGGVSVALQTWMMQAAPRAVEAATALFVAVFNLGIAAGSLLGVPSVDALGLQANLWLAAACMLAPLAILARAGGPCAARPAGSA
jgi:predicted MFS family arabinose efflux permease